MPQDNLAWTNENAYGLNLYNRHDVLYSTLGGWYEWVPPTVHFRQPYWESWHTLQRPHQAVELPTCHAYKQAQPQG